MGTSKDQVLLAIFVATLIGCQQTPEKKITEHSFDSRRATPPAKILKPKPKTEADRLLDQMIRRQKIRREQREYLAEQHYRRGKKLYDDSNLMGAERALEEALKLKDDHFEAEKLLTKVRGLLGRQSSRTHEFDRVAAAQSIRNQQLLVELQNILEEGRQLVEEEEYTAALSRFKKASMRIRFMPLEIDVETYRREVDQLTTDSILRQKEKERRIEEHQRRIAHEITRSEIGR